MSELELLQRRLEREKRARKEAEALMEKKARELFEVNQGLRKMAVELTEARNLANQASQAKSAFLANTSHELRTPLNAIIGYSELLAEDAEAEGRTSELADLRKICAAGRHLLSLIDEVLDLSKIEAGKMELRLSDCDVNCLVDEIISVITPLVEKNSNRLELDIEDALGVIKADEMRLRQVILNLMSNACKFTSNGRVMMKVRRTKLDNEDKVAIVIADTGIGLSEKELKRIFEPFSQADASTSTKFGGTGLGLALSRQFCRMMGGDITVESEPGCGAKFTVLLPANGVASTSQAQSLGQSGESATRGAPSSLAPIASPFAAMSFAQFLGEEL